MYPGICGLCSFCSALKIPALPHFKSPLDLILKLLLSICTGSLIIEGLTSQPEALFSRMLWQMDCRIGLLLVDGAI